MKQVLVLIVVAAVLTVLLGGCGAMRDNGLNQPMETYPMTGSTLMPGEVMPDPRDGEVTDTDGIIGDADYGARTDVGDRIDEAVEDVRDGLGLDNENRNGNGTMTGNTNGNGNGTMTGNTNGNGNGNMNGNGNANANGNAGTTNGNGNTNGNVGTTNGNGRTNGTANGTNSTAQR